MSKGIYKIINNLNNKCYIGKSINIEQRWYCHRSLLNSSKHTNEYLQRSWNKFGKENFSFIIIENIDNESLMNEREIYWINILNCNDQRYGYNLTTGGEGIPGHKHNDDTKRKIGQANRGHKNGMYGKKASQETRDKLSKAHKGWKGHWLGSNMSEEHKRNISLSLQGHEGYWTNKNMSKEHKNKISQSMKGKPSHNKIIFSIEQINDIRNRKDVGESYKSISKIYCCGASTIFNLLKKI